jgi:hypothetical protein
MEMLHIGTPEWIVLTLMVAGLAFVIASRRARHRREELGPTPHAAPAARPAFGEVLGRDWREPAEG